MSAAVSAGLCAVGSSAFIAHGVATWFLSRWQGSTFARAGFSTLFFGLGIASVVFAYLFANSGLGVPP